MIGIDIIDLSSSFDSSKYSLQAYQGRILNTSESSFCDTFNDLDILWAIKESTYKCYFRETGNSFLSPKKILVTFMDKKNGTFYTRIGTHFYKGRFYITSEYVYAISVGIHDRIDLMRVYLRDRKEGSDTCTEFDFFFQTGAPQASFCHHRTGFPESIRLGASEYPYSRSHHGSFFISVIAPGQDN